MTAFLEKDVFLTDIVVRKSVISIIKLLAITYINICDSTNICKPLFEYFYLQMLVAQPVPNVYLEKDVALPVFVVRVFIHCALGML